MWVFYTVMLFFFFQVFALSLESQQSFVWPWTGYCVSLLHRVVLLTEVTSIKYLGQRLPHKIQIRDISCHYYYCLLSTKSMFPDNLNLWRPQQVKSM